MPRVLRNIIPHQNYDAKGLETMKYESTSWAITHNESERTIL